MNKLSNLLSINCITSIDAKENQQLMTDQCEKYKLNLNFHNSYQGLGDMPKLNKDYSSSMDMKQLCNVLSHLKAIQTWYLNTDDDYGFFCEDNVLLNSCENWAFTWKEFYNKLPDKWGIIQLSIIRDFELSDIDSYMKFHSYVWDNWSASSYIISRDYAKLLIDSHIVSESEYDLSIPAYPFTIPYIENILYNVDNKESAYSIPLFIENADLYTNTLQKESINVRKKSSIIVDSWWKQNGDQKSLRWFFNEKTKDFDSNSFLINPNYQENKRIFIVDNFYQNPDAVREFALQQEYFDDPGYIGRRTRKQHFFPGLKEAFEEIMNYKIMEWEEHGMNGRFQHNWSGEPLVYHCDAQKWAGIIYLTPDAPPECGTTTWRHKKTKIHHNTQIDWNTGQGMEVFNGRTFVDRTPYEPVDVCGNVYNRLVIFSGGCIHSASEYFGDCLENCRLWHMFFFG